MSIRLFVNERPVTVADGSDILGAVTSFDSVLGDALRSGRAYVTDGVGLRVDPAGRVSPGAIFRVVVSARRSSSDGMAE